MLYPALHRLERKGWIISEWGVSENNRRAKYYELIDAGRAQLRQPLDQTWSLESLRVVIRTDDRTPSLARTLQSVVARIDPSAPVSEVQPMQRGSGMPLLARALLHIFWAALRWSQSFSPRSVRTACWRTR